MTPQMLVLDVGSGAFPNVRSDVLCDRDLIDNRHRAGLEVVVDRPMVRADACLLPFRDKAFDFVIASHIAEHIEDPDAFCAELARVADAGYIETPSPVADCVLNEEYHIWRVGLRGGLLLFAGKRPQRAWERAVYAPIYRIFYAGQPSCGQPTYRLPAGRLGLMLAWSLRAFGAFLNRMGLMHTRFLFTPQKPLRWKVFDGGSAAPRSR